MSDSLVDMSEMDTGAWEAYVKLTSQIIGLPIPESSLPGVVDTLMTTARVAKPLLDMELPEATEMGPGFVS
jgi:hypothetical protein